VVKLAREKGFLETLFNTIQEGVLVIDAEGRISYLNAAASQLLGLDPGRSIGAPVTQFLRELDWQKIGAPDGDEWHNVLSHELEVFYPRHALLSFYIVPLVEEETTVVTGAAIILRDVTESRRRTESAIESEKLSALTLLAAGVAHEIGNPLNSLNIHFQLMERELKSLPVEKAQRLRDDLRVARDEIARLDRIINQFLRAIRPTKPDLQRASVNEVVTKTLALLEREIADRDILVEQELDDNLPKVLLDRTQLQQAFYNVIRNSIQAMQAGGILRVRTEATDAHLSCRLSTPARDSARSDRTDLRTLLHLKEDGSGLGLMIVQRIVREHGGTIEVDSSAGRGTTFRIKLPIHEKRMRLLEAGGRWRKNCSREKVSRLQKINHDDETTNDFDRGR